jgi:hypothetical protein
VGHGQRIIVCDQPEQGCGDAGAGRLERLARRGRVSIGSVVPLIFPDGSTSSLAIQRSGDSDTGLFINANGFYFSKDGTEYARIVGNDNQFKGVVRIKPSASGKAT